MVAGSGLGRQLLEAGTSPGATWPSIQHLVSQDIGTLLRQKVLVSQWYVVWMDSDPSSGQELLRFPGSGSYPTLLGSWHWEGG